VGGLPRNVAIKEVAPRDGLQSEPKVLPTGDKLRLVGALADAGLKEIEKVSKVGVCGHLTGEKAEVPA
jgi:hydroxymethylglutaryl-CoA lyase